MPHAETPFLRALTHSTVFEPRNACLEDFLNLYRASLPRSSKLTTESHEWSSQQQREYLKCFVLGLYEPPFVVITTQFDEPLDIVADGQCRLRTLLAFVNGQVPWLDDDGDEIYFVEPSGSNTSKARLKLLQDSEKTAFLEKDVHYVSIGARDDRSVENFLYSIRFNRILCPDIYWTIPNKEHELVKSYQDGQPGLQKVLACTSMNGIRGKEILLVSFAMIATALRSDLTEIGRLLISQKDYCGATTSFADWRPAEKARLVRIVRRFVKVVPKVLEDAKLQAAAPAKTLHPIEVIALFQLITFTMDTNEQKLAESLSSMLIDVRSEVDSLQLDQRTWTRYRKVIEMNVGPRDKTQSSAPQQQIPQHRAAEMIQDPVISKKSVIPIRKLPQRGSDQEREEASLKDLDGNVAADQTQRELETDVDAAMRKDSVESQTTPVPNGHDLMTNDKPNNAAAVPTPPDLDANASVRQTINPRKDMTQTDTPRADAPQTDTSGKDSKQSVPSSDQKDPNHPERLTKPSSSTSSNSIFMYKQKPLREEETRISSASTVISTKILEKARRKEAQARAAAEAEAQAQARVEAAAKSHEDAILTTRLEASKPQPAQTQIGRTLVSQAQSVTTDSQPPFPQANLTVAGTSSAVAVSNGMKRKGTDADEVNTELSERKKKKKKKRPKDAPPVSINSIWKE